MGFFDHELEYKGIPTLAGTLQDFGNKLQKELRNKLSKKVSSFSSKSLEQSIVFDIQLQGNTYVFELKMNDYWKYIDEGVQGASHQGGEYAKRKSYSEFWGKPPGSPWENYAPGSQYKFTTKAPPIDDIRTWANVAGLNVYAVQKSIFHQGIKPRKFYTDTVNDELINKLVTELSKNAKKALELDLAETIKGNAK